MRPVFVAAATPGTLLRGALSRVAWFHIVLLGVTLSITLLTGTAVAQPSANGSRPGNDAGTGTSPPMGNRTSNLTPWNTPASIGSNLPPTNEVGGEQASDYLRVAQGALAAGRTRETQQALEMAQTRMLDRSVPIGQTNNPSDNPTVKQISQALQALAGRDRATCMQLIQAAIGSADAQRL